MPIVNDEQSKWKTKLWAYWSTDQPNNNTKFQHSVGEELGVAQ